MVRNFNIPYHEHRLAKTDSFAPPLLPTFLSLPFNAVLLNKYCLFLVI
ncbi:hypothetical protein PLEI_2958 [Photobacterium leiognathi lrivu.4.1]|uniref:Uncharacterized protein n=1 Tax=Photobacterium leiognathi lrivu.4.1 TaxID=1248232 RepID=V5F274_PHOLE|nr:hypothetical protein PLEI_2958 [Photobacterium leiognathi lrivu.4.1]